MSEETIINPRLPNQVMEVIVLGTSSGVPTKDRNQTGYLVSTQEYDILVDCGEGIQRQIKVKGITPSRIKKILITHWHGDHTLGLIGLLQTFAFLGEGTTKLEIYGPKYTRKRIKTLMETYVFQGTLDLTIKECTPGLVYEDNNLEVHCAEMEHSTECLAYSIKQKDKRRVKLSFVNENKIPKGPLLGKLQDGKSITFNGKKIFPNEATYVDVGKKLTIITDTAICNDAIKIAKDSDLLICEATFAEDLKEKAVLHKHMTTKDAAAIASRANVKQLILSHFSQRYKDVKPLEEEAKEIFSNTKAAYDFMRISF